MTIAAVILGLLPGFAWLFFYLKEEETHPEPKRLIVLTFILGGLSTLLAYLLQSLAAHYDVKIGIQNYSLISLVILALIEEASKFLAAYVAVRRNQEFKEPVDAMIYLVVAALGFATVENLGALVGTQSGPPLAQVNDFYQIAAFRSVGTTLLHSLTSAILGYYWAISMREFGMKRFIIKGLIVATALHALFNWLILYYSQLSYSLVLVAIIGFFALSDFEKLKVRKI